MPSDAVQAEAVTGTVEVRWRDLVFTVPTQPRWTVRTLEAVKAGDWIAACHALLGDVQWEAFLSADPEPVMADLGDLVAAVSRGLGFEGPGE